MKGLPRNAILKKDLVYNREVVDNNDMPAVEARTETRNSLHPQMDLVKSPWLSQHTHQLIMAD